MDNSRNHLSKVLMGGGLCPVSFVFLCSNKKEKYVHPFHDLFSFFFQFTLILWALASLTFSLWHYVWVWRWPFSSHPLVRMHMASFYLLLCFNSLPPPTPLSLCLLLLRCCSHLSCLLHNQAPFNGQKKLLQINREREWVSEKERASLTRTHPKRVKRRFLWNNQIRTVLTGHSFWRSYLEDLKKKKRKRENIIVPRAIIGE